MKNLGLWLHYATIIVAGLLFGIQFFILSPIHYSTNTTERPIIWCLDIAGVLSAYGLASGFVLMAMRKGKSESLLLAISTIIALLLLFFSGHP